MDNGNFTKEIVDEKSEQRELELFKAMAEDKQREFIEYENPIVRPLSEYSTTQLKAELRRRKKERR